MEALVIPKEKVSLLRFPAIDVLHTETERHERLRKLQKALTLGNLEKQKVLLLFDTIEGPRSVETTIWGVMDEYIFLKGGSMVPIRVVYDVHF